MTLAALALVGLGLSRTAWAAPSTPDARARELFEQGDAAYAKKHYEQALAAFQEAYDLSKRPQLLFNVANALERLNRLPEALEALEKYVESGKAKDRLVLDERIATLKKKIEEKKKADQEEEERKKKKAEADAAAAAAGAAKPADPPKDDPPPGPKPPEKSSSVLPIALLGAGGAALATAGVFGLLTLSARSELDDGCKAAPDGRRFCLSDTESTRDREYTFGIVTDVAAVSGVVLGGVGLYLFLTRKTDAPSAAVEKSVVIRPKGPGMELVGTF